MFGFIQLILSSYVLLLNYYYYCYCYYIAIIFIFVLFPSAHSIYFLLLIVCFSCSFIYIYICISYHRLRYEVYLFQAFSFTRNRAKVAQNIGLDEIFLSTQTLVLNKGTRAFSNLALMENGNR